MAFRIDQLEQAHRDGAISQPEAEIPVPTMAAFFDGEDKPTWKVRKLDGDAKARCNGAGNMVDYVRALLPKLLAGDAEGKAEATLQMAGYGKELTPEERIKRAKFVAGTIEPKIDNQQAALLWKYFPDECETIVARIDQLGGAAPIVGERKRSGKTPKSEVR